MVECLADLSTCSPGGRRRSSRIRVASSPLSEISESHTRNASVDVSSGKPPLEERKCVDPDPPLSNRCLRKRKNEGHNRASPDAMEGAMKPLTDEERRNWKGWVELESDPVRFRASQIRYAWCSHPSVLAE